MQRYKLFMNESELSAIKVSGGESKMGIKTVKGGM